MSVQDDIQAWLIGHAPLTALVAEGIAQNAVPEGADLPYVAWSLQQEYDRSLAGAVLATKALLSVECWGTSAEQADDVADAVVDALQPQSIWPASRATTFDPEQGLDATQLLFEWYF